MVVAQSSSDDNAIRYLLQGSHSFNSKKFQDFSRTFQDPRMLFQDVVAAQQYWNIKTNGSYLLKIYNVAV